ncbi:hypothetical protein J2T56_002494 [Natronobacillus azotifigens]|uniref:Uncharacterized protein n=1 Tax=Natronobacillus azotifigens TaxID=472978 RepID=A0A9J6RFK4_9BACI|nr:hypothetical protein [Natronobacillus azotifigens]MCZ0704198.1 hypothetical protein [Natronobacillus azotifigens]
MLNKILFSLIGLTLLVASGTGLFFRQTYTNVSADENMLDHFSVALWDFDYSPNLINIMNQTVEDSPIIIRAKSEGKTKYTFQNFTQEIIVEEVYRGDGLKVGDQIEIIDFNWHVIFDNMSVNASFINLMQPNNEYLIFLDNKLNTFNSDEKIYQTPSLIIPPIFNYEDKEHVILSVTEDNLYVPYKSVKENEFFVSSEESLAKLIDFKHEVLQKYPK